MSLFNLLFGKKKQPVENNPTSAEPLAEPTNADDDLAARITSCCPLTVPPG